MSSYRLVVGLGNPGPVYDLTRHNIGFEVLDRFARMAGAEFREDKRGPGEVARLEGSETLLLKPHTYMNRSGGAVRAWLDWKKWEPADVLVVVDEVALPLGALRFRTSGSPGGHNGLKDVERHLGSAKYARLRCGVGPMPPMWSLEKFVLAKYAEGEEEAHRDLVEEGAQALTFCLDEGMEKAMNRYNRRLKPVLPEEIEEDAGPEAKNPALSPDPPKEGN